MRRVNFKAVIVAAGSGLRAGPGQPKAWRDLGGRPILLWSVEALLAAGAEAVVLVVAPDRIEAAKGLVSHLPACRVTAGGASRGDSVGAGLAALDPQDARVLIHDAARPFVTSAHVAMLLAALDGADGAVPALPMADTLKRGDRMVAETVDRAGLWRAQTPQAFQLDVLRSAYAAWPVDAEPTDDAAVVERAGGRVALAPGDPMLMKLTYPEDFAMAETLAGRARVTRIGQGIDAHRFGPGSSVWLCGVEIPHNRGLVGHSDADCGLHALTDALLGAIGDGDIGQHFPPSDPAWKGASSDRFVRDTVQRVRSVGGELVSADITLICERPRVGPHREAMRACVADLLGLPVARVSIKATTTEGMGFTGREEGLMAQAVVSVEIPR
jgi:2-C-methyl-D-erythritol 4-phosphate cytidylyltransferase / 2-C-methyl-D-erythritol 2,4-cyclodiphosphate synthase